MQNEEREKFNHLIHRGENYIKSPSSRKVSGVQIWQKQSAQWLTENLPDSGLSEHVLLTPIPSSPYWSKGISSGTIRGVQKILKDLYRAKDMLPFLQSDGARKSPKSENINKVFIVHGHDTFLKISVARFLSKLDQEPVILHEQPDGGKTVIEKFEQHADVAFAVVLLTADDIGGKIGTRPKDMNYRARQNVILELGYFMGRIGRTRVAAIFQEGVEIPSDYSGVLYIPYDESDDWQLRLAKELKASGLNIDVNKII